MIIKNFKDTIETEEIVYTTTIRDSNGKCKQVYYTNPQEAKERAENMCYELIWDKRIHRYVIGNVIR